MKSSEISITGSADILSHQCVDSGCQHLTCFYWKFREKVVLAFTTIACIKYIQISWLQVDEEIELSLPFISTNYTQNCIFEIKSCKRQKKIRMQYDWSVCGSYEKFLCNTLIHYNDSLNSWILAETNLLPSIQYHTARSQSQSERLF